MSRLLPADRTNRSVTTATMLPNLSSPALLPKPLHLAVRHALPALAAGLALSAGLARAQVDVDPVQPLGEAPGRYRPLFTLPGGDKVKALDALHGARERIGFAEILYDDAIGKVSVIGVGMRSHPGVSATFFRALAETGINIQMISTSEIRISVVVGADDVDAAVRAAHTAFGLDSVSGEAVVYAGTGR